MWALFLRACVRARGVPRIRSHCPTTFLCAAARGFYETTTPPGGTTHDTSPVAVLTNHLSAPSLSVRHVDCKGAIRSIGLNCGGGGAPTTTTDAAEEATGGGALPPPASRAHATPMPPQHIAQITRGSTMRRTTAPAMMPPMAPPDKAAVAAPGDEHPAETALDEVKSELTELQLLLVQKKIRYPALLKDDI